MLLPLAALLDPFGDERDLSFGDGEVGLRRRHHVLRILRNDATEDLAVVWITRDYCPLSLAFNKSCKGSLFGIKAEVGRPRILVRTMAGKTAVRKDGFDVVVEINFFGKPLNLLYIYAVIPVRARRKETQQENRTRIKSKKGSFLKHACF